MTDSHRAQIRVRKVKKGLQAYIMVPTKKGGERESTLSPAILSADLAGLKPEDLEGVEVEFVLSQGQVGQVRRAGQEYVASAAASPPSVPGRGVTSGTKFSGGGHRGGGPQTERGPSSGGAASSGALFENPYNFVPAPPRARDDEQLGDRSPVGHGRYHPGHWSGCIGVRITTKTPLLIPDAAGARRHGQDHTIVGVRTAPDGSPCLPPTSVKGMLRSAYEAVTNSRFGVFRGHQDALALRVQAQSGGHMVPVRVTEDGASLELLPGTTRMGPGGEPQGSSPPIMYAAWFPLYERVQKPRVQGVELRTGVAVWAELDLWQHFESKRKRETWSNNFSFWRVVSVRPFSEVRPDDYSPPSRPREMPAAEAQRYQRFSKPSAGVAHRWVAGWMLITGKNIDNKHDERVFFVDPDHSQFGDRFTPLTDALRDQWKVLLTNYQEEHLKEIDQGQRRPPALRNQACVWSHHVTAGPASRDLHAGTCCYARVKQEPSGHFRVLGLYPVMISRDLYQLSPEALVDDGLLPATGLDELSPADRVFGWVRDESTQRGGRRTGQEPGAWKGQIRIGPSTCQQGPEAIESMGDPDGLPLAILGQPKPAQARFYVAGDQQGKPAGWGAGKDSGYRAGQGLRGHKVYPHQPQAELEGYWTSNVAANRPLAERMKGRTVYQEYRRLAKPGKPGSDRDGQNRSILAWVKSEIGFRFDIHVTNLSDVELGALLFLLRLPEGCHLRLGGGKPLGFGSVRLQVESVDLRDGNALADDYSVLVGRGNGGGRIDTVDSQSWKQVLTAYEQAVAATYGGGGFKTVPFIRAFLNACKGGALPVHFPRGTEAPDPEGENFKWFVDNERNGAYHPLPALWEPNRGLPYQPSGGRGQHKKKRWSR